MMLNKEQRETVKEVISTIKMGVLALQMEGKEKDIKDFLDNEIITMEAIIEQIKALKNNMGVDD